MEQTRFLLGEIPAILWGPPGDRGCLYIHGQGGGKEYAAAFAELAAAVGRQVLSIAVSYTHLTLPTICSV